MIISDTLDSYLQKQVDVGVLPLDLMHGHLKNLMLEADNELARAQEAEDESGEAMDSMERRYWEGISDAYTHLYQLTYLLSFAYSEREIHG